MTFFVVLICLSINVVDVQHDYKNARVNLQYAFDLCTRPPFLDSNFGFVCASKLGSLIYEHGMHGLPRRALYHTCFFFALLKCLCGWLLGDGSQKDLMEAERYLRIALAMHKQVCHVSYDMICSII